MFRKDAPILVPNEATSALDPDLKAAIGENFHALMTNRTVIAIMHRLSAVAALDGFLARAWKRKLDGFLHRHRQAETRPAQ